MKRKSPILRRLALGIALTSGVITIVGFTTGVGSLPGLLWSSGPRYTLREVDEEYTVVVPVAVVFSQPSSSSEILLTRRHGQSINVTGEFHDLNWFRVGGFGIPAGFVSASALKKRPAPDRAEWAKIEATRTGPFSDTEAYEGEKVGGKKQGRGIYSRKPFFTLCLSRDCNNIYAGDFRDGVYEGRGILQEDALTYMGDFIAGRMSGRGVLRDSFFKALYQGDFKDGEYDGEGILYDGPLTGNIYRGEFRKGKKDGTGVEANKLCLYRGNFEDGLYQGKGELLCSNGFRQEGEFDKGNFKKGARVSGNWFRGYTAREEMELVYNDLTKEVKAIRFFGPTETKP